MKVFIFLVLHHLWIFIIDDLSKLVLLRMWPVDHLHLIPEGVFLKKKNVCGSLTAD